MGNDIDVMSKDERLEEMFWSNVGPKDETTYQFFQRSFNGFCNALVSPTRSSYSDGGLEVEGYISRSFNLMSEGQVLRVCHWQADSNGTNNSSGDDEDRNTNNSDNNRNSDRINSPSDKTNSNSVTLNGGRRRLCVVYLHTNTRNLSDALEALPLCRRFGADLLAFDLPGKTATKLFFDFIFY